MRKYLLVITLFLLVISCTQHKPVDIYGNRVQEGVIFFVEVTDQVPEPANQFYYQTIRQMVRMVSDFPLPEIIEPPWCFAVASFNPLNQELRYLLVFDSAEIEVDYREEKFDQITLLYDETDREIGGYLYVEGKAYLYCGSSSQRYLSAIEENQKPFCQNKDYQKCAEFFSDQDWVRLYVPGTVFELLKMIPDEYLQRYEVFHMVKNLEITAFTGKISGVDQLKVELNVLSDTNLISLDLSFQGWNPEEIHHRILESFFGYNNQNQ
ncbi:MAG: hypothetical protein ACP5FK_12415 [bacterium]